MPGGWAGRRHSRTAVEHTGPLFPPSELAAPLPAPWRPAAPQAPRGPALLSLPWQLLTFLLALSVFRSSFFELAAPPCLRPGSGRPAGTTRRCPAASLSTFATSTRPGSPRTSSCACETSLPAGTGSRRCAGGGGGVGQWGGSGSGQGRCSARLAISTSSGGSFWAKAGPWWGCK